MRGREIADETRKADEAYGCGNPANRRVEEAAKGKKPFDTDYIEAAKRAREQMRGVNGCNPPIAAASTTGQPLKFDEGKLDLSLVEPWVEEVIARVYTEGLRKYTRDSWKQFSLEDARKLIAPAKRHLNEYRKGEFTDPATGLPHLVQAAWNLLTIYYHETRHEEK